MRCPHCPTDDLVPSQRQGIEIDRCPRCRGVWLDRGELDKIIQRASTAALDEVDAERREWAAAAERSNGGDRGREPARRAKPSFLSNLFDN